MTQTETTERKVAVDIENLTTKSGEKLKNALIANGGTVYRTARKRMAVLIPKQNFTNLQKRLKFTVEDSFDGTVAVTPHEVVVETQPLRIAA